MSFQDAIKPSGASAKFPTIGTTVVGVIEKMELRHSDFQDGDVPVVTLRMDDGELTDLWLSKNTMKSALADALAGAQLEIGGRLAMTYTADGVAQTPGHNPPKFYEAKYQAPAASAAVEAPSAASMGFSS